MYSIGFKNSDRGWDEMAKNICHDIDQGGFSQTRYLVSTSNYSEGNGQCYALLKWSKTHEDALADNTRGGCSCNIF